jgi:hypothetical protein
MYDLFFNLKKSYQITEQKRTTKREMTQFTTTHMATLLYDPIPHADFLIQIDKHSPQLAILSLVNRDSTHPLLLPQNVELTTVTGEKQAPILNNKAFIIETNKAYDLLQDGSVLLRLRPLSGWSLY